MPASAARGDGCVNMSLDIPSGLTELLQDFTVAVLRSRPDDLQQFAADYFGQVYERRVVTRNSKDFLRDVPVITTTFSHQEASDEEATGERKSSP
jgi:Regulatory subunit of type II PKA R-subunit